MNCFVSIQSFAKKIKKSNGQPSNNEKMFCCCQFKLIWLFSWFCSFLESYRELGSFLEFYNILLLIQTPGNTSMQNIIIQKFSAVSGHKSFIFPICPVCSVVLREFHGLHYSKYFEWLKFHEEHFFQISRPLNVAKVTWKFTRNFIHRKI